jgi:hypothetical protein
MTVIMEDGKDWRMPDVICVDGGICNPKVPTLFQVADVDTGVINWIKADLVPHICPGAERPPQKEMQALGTNVAEGDGLGTSDEAKGGLLSLFPLEVDLVAVYEQNSLKPSSQ